jgi:hypothetical protein
MQLLGFTIQWSLCFCRVVHIVSKYPALTFVRRRWCTCILPRSRAMCVAYVLSFMPVFYYHRHRIRACLSLALHVM